MADLAALGSTGRRRSAPLRLTWLRGPGNVLVGVALVIAALVAGIVVGPGIHASGAIASTGPVPLGTSAPADRDRVSGAVGADRYGYLVKAYGTAQVTVPLKLPAKPGARTLLRLWVDESPPIRTTVGLIGANGSERELHPATSWVDKTLDVTDIARGGAAQLQLTAVSRAGAPVLFFDGLAAELAPPSAAATASTASVAVLVLLLAAAMLAVCGRLRAHWALPLALAAFAALTWYRIPAASFEALPIGSHQTWNDVLTASWFGFHNGLLWGSWNGVSSLAVQLYHAFTPIVGTAPVGARSAALLTALLAVAAIYALGHRAAGRIGALVAVLVALAASPLRDAAVDGGSLPVLVLAAALVLYSLHACLAKATPFAVGMLGAALALVVLAEPLWLVGAIVALPVVVAAFGRRGSRWRALGAGALIAAIVLGPHLASSAAQNNGSLFADLNAGAALARNAEFTDGAHGAPTPAQVAGDPAATGQPVTLSGYVFGDHSFGQVVGSTLTGGHKALSAFAAGSSPLSRIAFAFALIGVAYALILPRLRGLVLVPLIIALPTLFIAGRITADDFAAGAIWWPVLPAGAAILAYAARQLAGPVLGPHLAGVRARSRRTLPVRQA